MSEYIQKIQQMICDNKGVITAREVRAAEIPTIYLTAMTSQGLISRIGRGIYAFNDTLVDEMYELALANRDIVFSHVSALYLHELTDRTPTKMTVTVLRTKNASALLNNPLVEVKRSSAENYPLGKTMELSPCGFPIPAYDLERTICDIVKNKKNTDPQVVNDALKGYVNRKDKDLSKLMQYAKQLKTEKQIRQYMEALL